MPITNDDIQGRLARLKADIVAQGRRVQAMVEHAFEAVFTQDCDAAQQVVAADEMIDRVDVEIERAAVAILTDSCSSHVPLSPEQMRMVLTIVKVNNELERIADVGVSIAEEARLFQAAKTALPPTFRVLTNSVIGIVRDATTALDKIDPEVARVVLLSEEAVGAFKTALIRDSQQQLSKGTMSLDFAMALSETATFCEVMVDHCTNIAEQVMYVATGTIVRHMQGHWEEVRLA